MTIERYTCMWHNTHTLHTYKHTCMHTFPAAVEPTHDEVEIRGPIRDVDHNPLLPSMREAAFLLVLMVFVYLSIYQYFLLLFYNRTTRFKKPWRSTSGRIVTHCVDLMHWSRWEMLVHPRCTFEPSAPVRKGNGPRHVQRSFTLRFAGTCSSSVPSLLATWFWENKA